MSDAIGMLQLFLDAVNPVLVLVIALSVSLTLAHGMVTFYKNF